MPELRPAAQSRPRLTDRVDADCWVGYPSDRCAEDGPGQYRHLRMISIYPYPHKQDGRTAWTGIFGSTHSDAQCDDGSILKLTTCWIYKQEQFGGYIWNMFFLRTPKSRTTFMFDCCKTYPETHTGDTRTERGPSFCERHSVVTFLGGKAVSTHWPRQGWWRVCRRIGDGPKEHELCFAKGATALHFLRLQAKCRCCLRWVLEDLKKCGVLTLCLGTVWWVCARKSMTSKRRPNLFWERSGPWDREAAILHTQVEFID